MDGLTDHHYLQIFSHYSIKVRTFHFVYAEFHTEPWERGDSPPPPKNMAKKKNFLKFFKKKFQVFKRPKISLKGLKISKFNPP